MKYTKDEILQMAVDYYTLTAIEFENKYPIRPPEKPNIPCWVELAIKALSE